MERPFRILLFLLSALLPLLFGCGGGSCPSVLVVADSLISVAPDSALRYLENLGNGMSSASESVRMYYRLLCIKAADKAYIPHTSDSLILPVLRYYEKKDKRHLAEARYYAGRVYRDLGDAPQALDYFGKALEALPEEEISRQRIVIYSQMGTLFLYQHLYDNALEVFRKRYACNLQLDDSVGMIYTLRDIGDAYHGLEQTDSALHYFQRAYHLGKALNQKQLVCTIQN